MIGRFIRFAGPLRAMLYAGIVLLMVAAAFSLGGTQKSGIMMFPTLIVPAVVPMIFFVMPLDMTMCAIMMSGKDDAARYRYHRLLLWDLASMGGLVGAWWPFYSRLLIG